MKKIIFFLPLILTVFIAVSQKLTVASNPQQQGFSADRLKRIDDAMNDWVSKGWVNGAVGLIARNGEIVYYKSAGYDNTEMKTALPKDDIFRIASQTKAITTAAAMILFEEGKFLLDDPVAKYIPSFARQQVLDKFNAADTTYTTVPATRDITIRDIITHTSGLGYAQIGSPEAKAIYAKNNITAGLEVYDQSLAQAMTKLGTLPLMNQPGEKWSYSLGIDLLGYLVEIWSGMSLDEFFQKRIFQPLGMKDTYFNVPAEKASRLATMYREDSLGHLNLLKEKTLGISADYPLKKKAYFSGGGGLSSTIYDYAIFLQMMLNGGEYNGVRLLSRNTVRIMTQNQIGDIDFGGNKFGLGFSIVTNETSGKSLNNEGTYSWGGAFATSYWVDPKDKMVIVFYRQLSGTTHGQLADYFNMMAHAALND